MPPVIELRSKPWQSLILLPFIVALVVAFYWVVFGPGVDPESPPGLAFKIAAVFVIGVGTFLFIHFLRMTIKPSIILRVDEEGIMMNTGVSTGVVRWESIDRITLKPIRANTSNGPQYETVVAVYLKEPESYRGRYNFFLRKLIKLNESVNGPSIMIPFVYVRKEYDAFSKLAARKTRWPVTDEQPDGLV